MDSWWGEVCLVGLGLRMIVCLLHMGRARESVCECWFAWFDLAGVFNQSRELMALGVRGWYDILLCLLWLE